MSSQEKEASPVKFSFRRTWQHNSNNEGFRGLFGCGTEACSMFRSTTSPAVKNLQTLSLKLAKERSVGPPELTVCGTPMPRIALKI